MNYTAKISLTIAILAIIAGGVWYARKGAPEAPPADGGTNGQEVDNTDDRLSDDDVDISKWVEYKNEKIGFSIKHPIDYTFKEGGAFEVDVIGCFTIINEGGEKICRGGGGGSNFQFDTDFKGGTSLEGLEFTNSKYEEVLGRKPNVEKIKQVNINGKIYYQAEYLGGDATDVQTYLPTKKGLLIYSYRVSPIENDPDTVYHEQMAKTILSTLKFD